MKDELNKFLEAIKADYAKWINPSKIENHISQETKDNSIANFNAGLRIEEGKVYYKVISGSSVHSFIVKEDGSKFKKGDILKAAGWSAPAKNRSRGNIFGQYKILWTGTWYIRG